MLDPAILHDLQRAMVPPSLPPLAIVREWNSPMAEKAERDMAPILAASEIMVADWRNDIGQGIARLFDQLDVQWPDAELVRLDGMILELEARAERGVRSSMKALQRERRQYAELFKLDPSVAAAQRRHSDRIHEMRKQMVDAMLETALQLRAYRAQVDTRLGPSVTFDNPDDLTAFLEAAIAA